MNREQKYQESRRTYTITQYAKLNECCRKTVYKWIENGDVETTERSGKTLIIDWVRLPIDDKSA